MNQSPHTPLLDLVNTPDDLRRLKPEQLRQLDDELRAEMIDAVSTSGGHLGSGLGVVELTVARAAYSSHLRSSASLRNK